MARTILRLEKALAIVFASFFVAGSIVTFGFALYYLAASLYGAGRGVDPLLDAVALTAVAFAVLELGGTILSEEMARDDPRRDPSEIRRTLSRFVYVVITALAIEGLLLVFKYNIADEPGALPYAAAIIAATALLLVAIAIYNRLSVAVETSEIANPELAERPTGAAATDAED